MILFVYGVRVINGEKRRLFLGTFGTLPEAKHMAKCAALANAGLAYVKDTTGATVFSIASIDPNIYYGLGAAPAD